jgi:hypothetical protein
VGDWPDIIIFSRGNGGRKGGVLMKGGREYRMNGGRRSISAFQHVGIGGGEGGREGERERSREVEKEQYDRVMIGPI